MNSNDEPRQKNPTGTTGSDSSPLQPTTNTAASNTEEEKRRRQKREEVEGDVLKNIPLVGPYLAWVKWQFGWTGLLLMLAGSLVAVILIYIGLLPQWLVSEKYKPAPVPTPAPVPQCDIGYELIEGAETVFIEAFENAKTNMEVSAVALKALNLNTLKEKIAGDFRADIVVLSPCSDAVRRMPDDTGLDSGASRNIPNLLAGLKSYWQLLPDDKKEQLKVRLSKRPAPMVVAMFDHRRELYAYWCRYGAPCTKSHVLAFKHYGEKKPEYTLANQAGLFFEHHYNAVFRDAQPLDLNAYDPDKPCPPQAPKGLSSPQATASKFKRASQR